MFAAVLNDAANHHTNYLLVNDSRPPPNVGLRDVRLDERATKSALFSGRSH
jgi:hypothetical protein